MKGRCKVPFKETVPSHLSLGWWNQEDLAGEIGEQFKHKGHDLTQAKSTVNYIFNCYFLEFNTSI